MIPTRFNPDTAALIIQAVMLGMDPDRAALAYGMRPHEHEEWIARGSAEEGSTALAEPMLVDYVHALDVAAARGELRALRHVLDGGAKSDPHKWFLERRYPEKWAKVPASVRAAEHHAGQAPADEETPENVAPESRLDRARREREERDRRAAGESA